MNLCKSEHDNFSLFILLNWQLSTKVVQYISGNQALLLLLVFSRLTLAHVGITELQAAASNAFRDLNATNESVIKGCCYPSLRLLAFARLLLTKLLHHVCLVNSLGPHLVVQSSHRAPL